MTSFLSLLLLFFIAGPTAGPTAVPLAGLTFAATAGHTVPSLLYTPAAVDYALIAFSA